jgi:hypothetical protein
MTTANRYSTTQHSVLAVSHRGLFDQHATHAEVVYAVPQVCEIHLASRHRSSRLYQAGQDSDGRQPGSHVQAPNEEVLRSSWKSKAA